MATQAAEFLDAVDKFLDVASPSSKDNHYEMQMNELIFAHEGRNSYRRINLFYRLERFAKRTESGAVGFERAISARSESRAMARAPEITRFSFFLMWLEIKLRHGISSMLVVLTPERPPRSVYWTLDMLSREDQRCRVSRSDFG